MKPETATHIDTNGDFWRINERTRHWEKCIDGIWWQDDSADVLIRIDEAEPNGYSYSYREQY